MNLSEPDMMDVATLTKTSSLPLPTGSYIYRIVPVERHLAAISSDDSLRLVDPTYLQEISSPRFSQVHAGVTCLETLKHDNYALCTAGRDAVAKYWDLRSGQKTSEFRDESKAPYLSLCNSDHHCAVGTELSHNQASVILWDIRSPLKPIQQYVESHNDDVTVLQFHPEKRGILLSGSTDGLVNIYDIAQTDEDDALIQVANHGSSINHANFVSNSQFFAISHDENFSVYQLENVDESATEVPPQVFGDLRPQLECEYIVDAIPSIDSSETILGAGSHSKQHLDLTPLRFADQWAFDTNNTLRLPGAHGEEIVRSIYFNPEAQTIFTAGEDGLIRAWLRAAAAAGSTQQHMLEADAYTTPSRIKKKRNSGGGEGTKASRFKPY